MRYIEFKNKVLGLPLITNKDIAYFAKDKQAILNQLRRWQDKGLIIRLRRGMYILNANDRKQTPNSSFIANQLYAPSYVSLEYALSFYGIIPERAVEVTSVTTKKTARFKNELGAFIYRHIKPAAFRAFKAAKDANGLAFFIAEPEKAVVDFLYLKLNEIRPSDKDIFEASYRFQNIEGLSQKRITELAELFNSDKLNKVSRLFCEFIKRERR